MLFDAFSGLDRLALLASVLFAVVLPELLLAPQRETVLKRQNVKGQKSGRSGQDTRAAA